jgi:hypothetical protein
MAYVSPGGAFANSFSDAIDKENAARRQAMLDALHVKQVESEIASGQAALAEKRQEHQDKLDEQERKDTLADVGAMGIGDVPSADLLARAKKHHIDLRTTTSGGPVENPIPQTFGQTATDLESPKPVTRFGGNNAQIKEAAQKKQAQDFIASLPDADPRKAELKQAFEAEAAGLKVPPGYFAKQGSGDGEAVMQQNTRTGAIERLIDGKWVPWTTDVPKGAHWMTDAAPKDTSARDARKGSQIQTLHENAVKELDGWTKQTQGEVEVLRKLEPMLNNPTPITDRLVSPETLKLIVAGQGSGFRMTRTEIDGVTHGRSRWEDLDRAIAQWSLDPTQALSLSDTQRTDLKALVAEEKKRTNQVAHQVIDARTEFDDAMVAEDPARINKARTKLQQQFLSLDAEADNRTHYDIVNGKLVVRPPKGK